VALRETFVITAQGYNIVIIIAAAVGSYLYRKSIIYSYKCGTVVMDQWESIEADSQIYAIRDIKHYAVQTIILP